MMRSRGFSGLESPRFECFTGHYRGLFGDQRLYRCFQSTVLGILAGGSCRVTRIAAAGRQGAGSERRIRRLLRGENQRSRLGGDAVGELLTSQGAARLAGEHEVLVILDESDLRKPHARNLEHLDVVRNLQGRPVAGFRTLNALGIGESGVRALLYHTSFSSRAPGFKSTFDEFKKAVVVVTLALRAQGVGRLLWILDRGFDNLRVLRYLESLGECFVVRVQHEDRRLVNGGSLASRLSGEPPVGRIPAGGGVKYSV